MLKKNPLKNKQVLLRLNPYAKTFSKEKLGSQKASEGKSQRPGLTGNFQKIMHTDA